jgi:hypothetical protein
LATLTAINSALQTENDKFRKQLAEAAKPKTKGDAEVAGNRVGGSAPPQRRRTAAARPTWPCCSGVQA